MIGIFSDNFSISEIEHILKGLSLPLEDFSVHCRPCFAPENIRIGICEGSNEAALKFFASLRVPVITCSMSPLDTVTLSSKTKGFCTVTVQRSCPRSDNKSIEAAEYPLRLCKDYSDFAVLAVFCVLLLNGFEPEVI